MAHVGLITGSGFYTHEGAALAPRTVATPFGPMTVTQGPVHAHAVTHLARHGAAHERLSHQVEHRANLWALHELGVEAIVASTAVGLLTTSTSLGVPILFDDMYFPSNRLPDGSLATIFTTPGDARVVELLARHGAVVGRLIDAFLASMERDCVVPLDTGSVFRIEGNG